MGYAEDIKTIGKMLGIDLDFSKNAIPAWITKVDDIYTDINNNISQFTKIFSLSEFSSSYNSYFTKIFSLSDFSTSWATVLNKIFSLTEFNNSWSETLNKVFGISDLSTAFPGMIYGITPNIDFLEWINALFGLDENSPFIIGTDGTGQLSIIWQYNSGTNFTLEIVLYSVFRKMRNIIVNALVDSVNFIDDVLPDETEIYLPVFSGVAIRLAFKDQNGDWQLESEEWPETSDPTTIHQYFELPVLPFFDVFHMTIPLMDISKTNVYRNVNGEYVKTNKYNTRDLLMDFFGISTLILISYVIAKLGLKHMSDKVFKQANTQQSNINNILQVGETVYNNTYVFNKTMLANTSSVAALITSLLGSAQSVAFINGQLSEKGLPTLPEIEVNDGAVMTDILEAIDDVDDDILSDIADINSDIEEVSTQVNDIELKVDTANLSLEELKTVRRFH